MQEIVIGRAQHRDFVRIPCSANHQALYGSTYPIPSENVVACTISFGQPLQLSSSDQYIVRRGGRPHTCAEDHLELPMAALFPDCSAVFDHTVKTNNIKKRFKGCSQWLQIETMPHLDASPSRVGNSLIVSSKKHTPEPVDLLQSHRTRPEKKPRTGRLQSLCTGRHQRSVLRIERCLLKVRPEKRAM